MPSGKRYDWKDGLAVLDKHSIAKHEVLVEYLKKYFVQRTLNARQRDRFRITLVDGFSGGGEYRLRDTNQIVLGSPLHMLNSVKEAQFIVNQGRTKPLNLDVQYCFVDKDLRAVSHLNDVLIRHGYSLEIGKSIHILSREFGTTVDELIARIQTHTPRAPTALFFLDQYGYKEVPAPLIRKIFANVRNAEIIMTFHVDAFATYSTNDLVSGMSQSLGIDIGKQLAGRSIDEIKKNNPEGWRRIIQLGLYKALTQNCGAAYFTPFFIHGAGSGHGEYWLVHMAQVSIAQDVMKQTHWQFHNHFVHYGAAGLDMLSPQMIGFHGEIDGGFRFDEVAREKSINTLTENLCDYLARENRPMTIRDVFSATCNGSPATIEMYKIGLERLIGDRKIRAFSENGTERRVARLMEDNDILERNPQIILI